MTAKLISAFVFATRIVQFLLYLTQSFKLLACFCSCTGWIVLELFGNHIVGFPTRRLIFLGPKPFYCRYWYFGPLKHRFTYLRSALGDWPPNLKGTAQYVLPSDGTDQPRASKKVEEPKRSWSWRDLLFSRNSYKKSGYFYRFLRKQQQQKNVLSLCSPFDLGFKSWLDCVFCLSYSFYHLRPVLGQTESCWPTNRLSYSCV